MARTGWSEPSVAVRVPVEVNVTGALSVFGKRVGETVDVTVALSPGAEAVAPSAASTHKRLAAIKRTAPMILIMPRSDVSRLHRATFCLPFVLLPLPSARVVRQESSEPGYFRPWRSKPQPGRVRFAMARSRPHAFGDALRALRQEQGLSQEAAALVCGIDRAYFGKLERAAKVPTLTTLWRIADGFGTRPSELLARTEQLAGEKGR